MDSAELLSGLERCHRIPFWGVKWKPGRLKPAEMIEAGVRAGLLEHTRTDFGELAGETVYALGANPGIDSKEFNQHDEVVHLACIADIVTCAIRKSGSDPWLLAPDLPNWKSGCYLSPDGKHLRRVAFVTSWNDDRHYDLARSWQSLGEVVHHGLPMQLVTIILGQHRDGRYHSFWSHGLRHPANKKLRFRKRKNIDEPFKESWVEVWRSDYDDISTHDWLEGMLQDGVLRDVLLRYDIAVPIPDLRQEIVDLGQKKLEMIRATTELPLANLSTCNWPVPCVNRPHCHASQEPSGAYGFIRIA